jgi:hypothetical protein
MAESASIEDDTLANAKRQTFTRPSPATSGTLVLGGNVPLDVLARNVDEYLRR